MAHKGLVLWNARSIVKKLPDIKFFLQQYQPLVMGITETWLTPSTRPMFPNYTQVRKDRLNGTRGGLLFLVHHSLTFVEIKLNPFRGGKMETLAIKATTPVGQIHIFLCYNPCRDVPAQEIEHYALQLGPLSMMMGDFNAHHEL